MLFLLILFGEPPANKFGVFFQVGEHRGFHMHKVFRRSQGIRVTYLEGLNYHHVVLELLFLSLSEPRYGNYGPHVPGITVE